MHMGKDWHSKIHCSYVKPIQFFLQLGKQVLFLFSWDQGSWLFSFCVGGTVGLGKVLLHNSHSEPMLLFCRVSLIWIMMEGWIKWSFHCYETHQASPRISAPSALPLSCLNQLLFLVHQRLVSLKGISFSISSYVFKINILSCHLSL